MRELIFIEQIASPSCARLAMTAKTLWIQPSSELVSQASLRIRDFKTNSRVTRHCEERSNLYMNYERIDFYKCNIKEMCQKLLSFRLAKTPTDKKHNQLLLFTF
jgi:hypothetical protein